MAKDCVKPLEMQEIDSDDVRADAWLPIGNPLEGACFMLHISNDSTKDISISYDGITAHDFINSYTDITINLQTNSSPANQVSKLPKGTLIYVQGAQGSGLIYISGFYNG